MKNQNVNTANGKADFLEIKGAKNPIYQPMAGKAVIDTDNKTPETIDAKAEQTREDTKTKDGPVSSEGVKSSEARVLPIQTPTSLSAINADRKEEKPVMNLEGTLKLVEELHRRMLQRGRLVHTIDNLEKFIFELKEEAEDTTSNYYQGCELSITDDQRNKFSTKNPVIIKAVTQFVHDLCLNRLSEIEAEIIIPA